MWGWWKQVDFLRGAEEAAYRELTAPDAWVPYPDTEPVPNPEVPPFPEPGGPDLPPPYVF